MTVDWEIRCALFETIQLDWKLRPKKKTENEPIRHRTRKKRNIVQNFLQVQVYSLS